MGRGSIWRCIGWCQILRIVGMQALGTLQQALWWRSSIKTHPSCGAVHAERRRAGALAAAATRAEMKRKERDDNATAHLVSPTAAPTSVRTATTPVVAACFPAMHTSSHCCHLCSNHIVDPQMLHDLGQRIAATWLLLFQSCSSQGHAALPGCQSGRQGMRCC